MKSFFASLAVVAAAASSALAQFTINTPPSAVQCQPLLLQWSGGTPPYFLSVLPGNQPTAAPLVDLGTQTGTSLTWVVNIASGTSIGLTLRDSSGALAQSAAFTVLTSSDSSCVGRPVSSSSAPAGSSTSGSASGSAPASSSGSVATTRTSTTVVTTPSTTAPGTTAPPASSSSRPSSTAPAASSTSSKAAGVQNVASVGVAAGVGAALLALLA